MPESSSSPHGLFASARMLSATLVAALRTRLELLAIDTQEAGERIVMLMAWALAGLFCLFMGLVLVVLLVIVAFWDNSPLLAVGLLAAIFLGGAAMCAVFARAVLRAQPALFASTVAALQADRDALAERVPPTEDPRTRARDSAGA